MYAEYMCRAKNTIKEKYFHFLWLAHCIKFIRCIDECNECITITSP